MTPALMEKLKETMDAQTSGTEPGTSDSEPSPSGSEAKNSEFSLFVHRHCLVTTYPSLLLPFYAIVFSTSFILCTLNLLSSL